MKQLALILCAIAFILPLKAQQDQNSSPIIFIYDASGSMWGQMQGKTKMEIATEVLSNSVNELSENQKIGLVAYGHRQKGDCKDVEFLVDLNNQSKDKITSSLKKIKPLGMTPLAYSATQVIGNLRNLKEKATIILITDGIESCDGNICDVVTAAKTEGINFKLHIVGFGLKDDETAQLKCAAKAGEGNYYDAADANGLSNVMNEAVVQTIDKKEGNHGIYAVKNGEAIDAVVKAYNAGTTEEQGGIRTYRDTAFLYLPQGIYDIEVRPLENSKVNPITIKNIKTFSDKKTFQTVSFDGGKFTLTTTNNAEGWDALVKVTDMSGKDVGGTRTYGDTKEIELNPGTYNLKITALKMNGLETVKEIKSKSLEAGKSTEVTFDFKSGTLEILPMLNGNVIDCTANVIHLESGKSVAGGRTYTKGAKYTINPGTYKIEVRALGPNANLGSKTSTVTVETGKDHIETIQF